MLCSRLTVEFSPPWWVGTLERWEDGRKEGLGSCGSGTGSRKADTPSADGRGAPGGSPGTVPAAPAEAAAEAPGTLIPVCPAARNTPAGKIPAGVFFSPAQKFTIPCLYPCPKTRMIIEVLLLKGSDYHGNL